MARRTEEKTEDNAAEKTEEKAARKILCATCGALTTWEKNPWRPFCSERCKLTDLGAWAEEKYAIPSQESPGIFDPED